MKLIRFLTVGIVIFAGCAGYIDMPGPSSHTILAPELSDIRVSALGANNDFGMVPGLSLGGITIPECTQEDGSPIDFEVSYSMDDLPTWLSFDASTRALSLTEGSIVPVEAYDAAEVTYVCTDASDPGVSDSRTFVVNDLDGGGAVDGREYQHGEIPLLNKTGYFKLTPGNVDLYRPGGPSFLLPTNTTGGLDSTNAADDTEDFDGDAGVAGGGTNLEETINGTDIFLFATQGAFAPAVIYATGANPVDIMAADLDSDGDLDLTSSNRSGAIYDFSVFLNNGDGTYAAGVTYPTDNPTVAIAAADLDADGNVDLLTNQDPGVTSVFMGHGDGTFDAQVDYVTGGRSHSIIAADLDGDGDVDAAIGFTTPDISVLLNNGDGTFGASTAYATGDSPRHLTAADFDKDGDLDIATANSVDNNISVLMGNGDGTFAAQTAYDVGTGPLSIVASDFDEDGEIDLAVANNLSDNLSILLGNGDGTFAAEVTYGTGTQPNGLAATDLDGDGNVDLATANSGSNDVSVLFGNGDGTFAADVVYSTASTAPIDIVSADLDNDGALDLATINNNGLIGNVISVLLQD
ncbi:MAG: VCBS repeat-containing protein [bacterium]